MNILYHMRQIDVIYPTDDFSILAIFSTCQSTMLLPKITFSSYNGSIMQRENQDKHKPFVPDMNFIPDRIPLLVNRKKRLLLFFVVLLLISISGTLLIFYTSTNKKTPIPITNTGGIVDQMKPKDHGSFFSRIKKIVFHKKIDEDLIGEKNNRVNILLLGNGGPGHEGPYLTDTIILASVRPSTGEVALISIPRDLEVSIPDKGNHKINHANHFGELNETGSGAGIASYVVGDLLDIEIPYYVRVDFKAFRDIIELVGGVTVDVERSFTDNEYPTSNYQYQTVSFKKGIQTMDADTALKYARSRHGNNWEGGDFARGARQQKVILALKDKLLTAETLFNPVRMSKIISSLENNMITNLTFDEMVTLYNIAKNNKNNIIKHVLATGPNGLLEDGFTKEGSYILKPKAGNYNAIRLLAANIFDVSAETITSNVTPTQAPISDTGQTTSTVEIQNGTWRAGLAARVRMTLLERSIPVENISNTNAKPFVLSGIYPITPDADKEILERVRILLDIPVKYGIPDGELYASSTDILIIVGEDFDEDLTQ
jgi:polyisoprenyl-teichoic acid--peptidoglycan teichoic acid transferase